MPKIVINECHGGFSLSLKAKRMYLERIGKEAYFYMRLQHSVCLLREVESNDNDYFVIASTRDLGNWAIQVPDKCHFSFSDLDRDDPDLVATVEELGSATASGGYARLKVVNVPDDVDWYIEEYGGLEQVVERHRKWG